VADITDLNTYKRKKALHDLEKELLKRCSARGIDLLADALDLFIRNHDADRVWIIYNDACTRLEYDAENAYAWLTKGTTELLRKDADGFNSLAKAIEYSPDPFVERFAHFVKEQTNTQY